MHTTCPECSSVFRVTAEQLNIAHGQVRCGYCHTIFDALGSLEEDWKDQLPHTAYRQDTPADSAVTNDQQAARTPATTADETDLQQNDNVDEALDELLTATLHEPLEPATDTDLKQARNPTDAGSSTIQPHDTAAIKQRARHLFDEIQQKLEQKPATPTAPAQPDTTAETRTESEPPAKTAPALRASPPAATFTQESTPEQMPEPVLMDDVPEIIRDEVAAFGTETRQPRTLAWIAAIVLMMALLAAQGLYYFRDSLAQHEPYRQLIVGMCRVLSCEVPLRNDAQQGLDTLLMREHSIDPVEGHDDQLQIRVVFTNTANYTQSYPVLAVTMTDETGKKTALRRFRPQEYLAPHIDIGLGLPAHTSIEVIYNIIKPQTPIISYHIDFL